MAVRLRRRGKYWDDCKRIDSLINNFPFHTTGRNEKDFEIEPGESDSLHADYIIESDIKVSEFYFYLRNARKKKVK